MHLNKIRFNCNSHQMDDDFDGSDADESSDEDESGDEVLFYYNNILTR